jgi:hypothetical protein
LAAVRVERARRRPRQLAHVQQVRATPTIRIRVDSTIVLCHQDHCELDAAAGGAALLVVTRLPRRCWSGVAALGSPSRLTAYKQHMQSDKWVARLSLLLATCSRDAAPRCPKQNASERQATPLQFGARADVNSSSLSYVRAPLSLPRSTLSRCWQCALRPSSSSSPLVSRRD